MTAIVELGDERYTVEAGEVIADDPDNLLQAARARYLTTALLGWRIEQEREMGGSYDPDPDCTSATLISRRMQGRAKCGPPAPPPPPGVHY
jgi:hypothetical protein